jgi:hypothetical protein
MFDPSGQRTGLTPAPGSGVVDARPDTGIVELDAWSLDNEVRFIRASGSEELTCATPCTTSSLADVSAFRALAEALAPGEAYAMSLSQDTASFGVAPLARTIAGPDATLADISVVEDRLRAETMLEPFVAIASAVSHDESGPTLTIALLHDTANGAALNAGLLRRRVAEADSWLFGGPYSELLDVIEIEASGRFLTARFATESAAYWFGLIAAHDTLLLHR